MSQKYRSLTPDERDRLIAEKFPFDPVPDACPIHDGKRIARSTCDNCRRIHLWRRRMRHRFNALGLRPVFHESLYSSGDPKPPACPQHSEIESRNQAKTCEPCRLIRNWICREYLRDRQAGKQRGLVDTTAVRQHAIRLRDGGMTIADICRRAHVSGNTAKLIISGETTVCTPGVAQRILAIAVPERQFKLTSNVHGVIRQTVDATGTRRRIHAACHNGYTLKTQAARLGYGHSTLNEWADPRARSVVTVEGAAAVADLFPALMAQFGGEPFAVQFATQKRWLPFRYFTEGNIDDPSYDPFRKITAPGVRRRLRALAWIAQGPEQVAAEIGEKPADVIAWTDGRSHPAYVPPLIAAAYEKLSGRFGPATNAARHAREQGWPPPLAWQYIDIDHPNARAQTVWRHGDTKRLEPLQSQIDLGVMGFLGAADLIHPEKVAVVRRLHERGWSDRRIGVHMRWPADDVSAAVGHFRYANQITGYGLIEQWDRSRADSDFLVAPAR